MLECVKELDTSATWGMAKIDVEKVEATPCQGANR